MLSVGDKESRENGCGKMGVAVHELAHALGFWHEQSRTDRDDHVVIVQANIHPLMRRNFRKYTHELTDPLGVNYDYDSIMHYGEKVRNIHTHVLGHLSSTWSRELPALCAVHVFLVDSV